MFGFAAWKPSKVWVRALPSAGEACQPDRIAVPLSAAALGVVLAGGCTLAACDGVVACVGAELDVLPLQAVTMAAVMMTARKRRIARSSFRRERFGWGWSSGLIGPVPSCRSTILDVPSSPCHDRVVTRPSTPWAAGLGSIMNGTRRRPDDELDRQLLADRRTLRAAHLGKQEGDTATSQFEQRLPDRRESEVTGDLDVVVSDDDS